jgi:uncharacterized DUF497 family protein
LRIEFIICPDEINEKLARKHNVTEQEARQVLQNKPRIRFAENGYIDGEDVYAAIGRTFGGRYLSVFFVYKPTTRSPFFLVLVR